MIREAALVGAAAMSLGLAMLATSAAEPAAKRAPGTSSPDQPVVLELFTSQGCSSCPPADALAREFAKDENLVVISRPVTYWDRLGWKDTLAREDNTQLQRAYARRGMTGNNGVYTPQIVVDGQRATVGSNETIIRQMIRQSADAPAAIATRELTDGSMIVGLGGETDRPAELALIAMTSHVTVRVLRGENGDRALGYINVVRSEEVVDTWLGGKQAIRLPASAFSTAGADRYALVLRQKNAGRILAAADVRSR